MSEYRYTNALANETSPYLLQHAHNPVQWYPWGEEALSRAKREDKPILLSIGYSACHWCHVMERESFENEETAMLMNDNFINIKVDREERPDLDSIYMAAVQLITGTGGWPMTVFLTPDQEPFYGGTYFPPEDRYGRPGFKRVLTSIARAYRERKDAIYGETEKIAGELRKSDSIVGTQRALDTDILDTAVSILISSLDTKNGGFGQAPKFPPSMALSFLMRSYSRSGEKRLLEAVELTLTRMACGGIYDQVGGGFHRYSVDASWLVPHFEKMLYDNALLSRVYLDAYLLTRNAFYRQVAQDTLDYVAREMTSPEGGFYSSQDADSEGEEGRFYTWTSDEVEALLDEDEVELFCRYYGIAPEGNFEGKNILHVPRSPALVARLNNISEERLQEVVRNGKKSLFQARIQRVCPGRDEKILTAWNGLMLRSFAEAASSLGREDYRQAAVRNAEFVVSNLWRDGHLLRSYRNGDARFNAYLDDYASLMDGLVSLYEASFDSHWIEEARRLARVMTEKFWDREGNAFCLTSEDHEPLIHRPKEFYDNATPSGNSAAAYALLRLWRFTGDENYLNYALSILEQLSASMARNPHAFAHLLCALDFRLSHAKEIAVIGDSHAPGTKKLLNQVFGIYLPNKVVACGLDSSLFLLNNRPQIFGLPTAYVCENFTCKAPVTTPEELAAQLQTKRGVDS